MSNNLTRKGLATSTGLALALSTLIGVAPAQAAAGDVAIAPEYGSTFAVFNSDTFELVTAVRNGLTNEDSAGNPALAYRLTNADEQAFEVDLSLDTDWLDALDTANEDGYIAFKAYDARGVESDSGTFQVYEESTDSTTTFVVDFADLEATTVHLYDIETYSNLHYVDVTPLEYDSTDGTPDIESPLAGGYNYVGYGDGDLSLGITAWMELSASANYATVDANYASTAQTVSFYDPAAVTANVRIERFVDDGGNYYLNETEDDISFSVGFSKRVNHDQIDLSMWDMKVYENGTEDDDDDLGDEDRVLSGLSELDDTDRIYSETDSNNDGSGNSYRVTIGYNVAGARVFSSGGFTTPTGSADATDASLTVVDSVNTDQEDGLDTSFDLRAGTKSVKYEVQLLDAGEDLATAGVTVVAVVKAEGYLAPGAAITVSSAARTLSDLDARTVASGVTDAKGQWSFTVTTTSGIATEGYDIDLYYMDEDGFLDSADNYDADYAATSATTLEADNTLVSGATVNLTFEVTDQFGQPISLSGTKALNVELVANDSDDLEKTATVTNGKATFSFANYLAVGQTDTLTASVFTGSASAPTYLDIAEVFVNLYNTPAAASVSVPASQSVAVTYADFITGSASATNVAPSTDDDTIYTGTVVDANGAGIAGSLVTVSATGFQFRKYSTADAAGTGAYFKDSITVMADSNGQFSVQYWVHEASSTGKAITVTSGGKTGTTTVKSYLPENLGGDNLSFSWTLPANVVKNTTYAVVLKLADKWGNPVSTAGSVVAGVSVQGSGSLEINSVATAVSRNFAKDGTATVFLRSVKDIAGPGEITAILGEATYTTWDGDSVDTDTLTDLGANTVNAAATAWDETKWSKELTASIEVLDNASSIAKVNVGSFNGKLVVYANGYKGKKISWKVGGRWGSAVATSDAARFDRPTPRRGVEVVVELYVDGVKQLTKTVLTR